MDGVSEPIESTERTSSTGTSCMLSCWQREIIDQIDWKVALYLGRANNTLPCREVYLDAVTQWLSGWFRGWRFSCLIFNVASSLTLPFKRLSLCGAPSPAQCSAKWLHCAMLAIVTHCLTFYDTDIVVILIIEVNFVSMTQCTHTSGTAVVSSI